MEEELCPHCASKRHHPRNEEELKSLQNRISRIQGQSSHMNSCVKEGIIAGKDGVIDETVELIKKLK